MHWETKTNASPLLEIHVFMPFRSWLIPFFKYLKMTLKMPERIIYVGSVPLSSAQDLCSLLETTLQLECKHSNKKRIHPSVSKPLPCKDFSFLFLCIFVGWQKMESLKLYSYLFCSFLFVHLRPPFVVFSSACHVFGQFFCDLHPHNDKCFFLSCVKFHFMFFFLSLALCLSQQRWKSWIATKTFVPLDCVVAVADVGLLCREGWKRRNERRNWD